MVSKWILLLGTALFFAASTPVLANEHVSKVGEGNTYIAIDDTKGAFVIVVHGKEVGLIDEEGLHIYGDISYNGTMLDGTPPRLKDGKSDEE